MLDRSTEKEKKIKTNYGAKSYPKLRE